MIKSIIFTGGGSAGHVVPNIALIQNYLERKVSVSYIGSEEGIEKKLITDIQIPYYPIATGKLRRYWSLKNFTDPFKVILGMFQAWQYIGKIKPEIIFSKGGFVALPVVFGAWLRKIPVIAHESDLTPGLANRLSFPFVQKIAVTFSNTHIYPILPWLKQEKTIVTGTPIREELFKGDAKRGRQIAGFQNDKPCVLVIGGGAGSTNINEVLRRALPELLKTMNVIHCCGKGKMVSLEDSPNLANTTPLSESVEVEFGKKAIKGYKQFEYVNEELAHLYACSDIIISRAGANTVYEILALRKAALFIPLSLRASRGDQIANANFLSSQGLCHVLPESALTSDSLIDAIQKVSDQRLSIQEKIAACDIKSGTEAIINLINNTINEVNCEKSSH